MFHLFRPRPVRVAVLAASLSVLSVAAVGAPATGHGLRTAAASPASAAASVPAQLSMPFKAGESGYHCVRIPALVTTRTGDVLAFAEGRKRLKETGCHDVGDNDIVMKKSTDGGVSWSGLTIVVGAGDQLAHGNPAPVVDAVTGRVSLLYSSSDWNRDEAKPDRSQFQRGVHSTYSTDNAGTWAASTAQPGLKPAGWGWVSTGPGHGIQLARGEHHGRLVVPGDHTSTGNQAGAQLNYSDDGGLTWKLGAVSDVSKAGAYPGEPAIVETWDGGIHVNARSSEAARCNTNEHRLESTATGGGTAFATAFKPVANLDTSPTYGALLRLHAQDTDGKPNRLLYSGPSRLGPNPLEDRRDLAIRSSTDEGKTWQTAGTLISPARTGYSDMALLPNGSVAVLYETAGNIPHGNLAFTAFKEDAMDAAKTELRLPRTADTGPNDYRNHAVIHGGAQLGPRGSGKALELDGQDDYLRLVSCSDSLKVKDQDFTVTAWFKHSATNGALPIVWAYGMEDGNPASNVRQFWLKAEPASGRIRAAISTDTAFAQVMTESSYNDGAWHHVVFKRDAGKLVLAVDGGKEYTTPAPAGDITPPGQFTVHVGARPDFPNQPTGPKELFRGALDDIRLFGGGLSKADTDGIRDGAIDIANAQERLRLGFSTIW